jgi:hypothetical protein
MSFKWKGQSHYTMTGLFEYRPEFAPKKKIFALQLLAATTTLQISHSE